MPDVRQVIHRVTTLEVNRWSQNNQRMENTDDWLFYFTVVIGSGAGLAAREIGVAGAYAVIGVGVTTMALLFTAVTAAMRNRDMSMDLSEEFEDVQQAEMLPKQPAAAPVPATVGSA